MRELLIEKKGKEQKKRKQTRNVNKRKGDNCQSELFKVFYRFASLKLKQNNSKNVVCKRARPPAPFTLLTENIDKV